MPIVRGRVPALIVAAIASIAPLASIAQNRLTIDQAVSFAAANNLGLGRSAVDLEARLRASGVSWNGLVPALTASTGLRRANRSSISDATEKDRWSFSTTVGLSLSLTPGALSNVKAARLKYESGLIDYEQAARQLELTVRKSFYELLLIEEELRLAEQNIVRAQARYDQTAQKYASGLVPDIDLMSARVSLEKLRPRTEAYRTQLANGLEQFKILLGLDPGKAVGVSGSLDMANDSLVRAVSEAKDGRSGASPDVAALRKSVEIAEAAERAAALGARAPTLSLSLTATPTYANPLTTGAGGWWSDQGALSLGLSLPVDSFLPWSAARERIAEAGDAVKKARSALEEGLRSRSATVSSSLRGIDASRRSLAVLGLNVDLAQKTYDLTQEAYSKGAKDLLALQGAAGDLESARLDVLAESYNLVAAVLDLEYALGLPFADLGR